MFEFRVTESFLRRCGRRFHRFLSIRRFFLRRNRWYRRTVPRFGLALMLRICLLPAALSVFRSFPHDRVALLLGFAVSPTRAALASLPRATTALVSRAGSTHLILAAIANEGAASLIQLGKAGTFNLVAVSLDLATCAANRGFYAGSNSSAALPRAAALSRSGAAVSYTAAPALRVANSRTRASAYFRFARAAAA